MWRIDGPPSRNVPATLLHAEEWMIDWDWVRFEGTLAITRVASTLLLLEDLNMVIDRTISLWKSGEDPHPHPLMERSGSRGGSQNNHNSDNGEDGGLTS